MSSQAERVVDALTERFGGGERPVAVASAPGRVNLIGGHTDYNDGFVLPAAIDRRTAAAARPRDDGTLAAYAREFDEEVAIDVEAPERREDGHWANYVAGVATHLRAEGYPVGGADLVIGGNVPIGAGLASSAALELAAAGALSLVHGCVPPDEELAALCWAAENEFVGLSCGIMDQFTAAFAERDAALFLDCRTREREAIPLDGDRAGIVVVDTNVQHELVDSAYNDRVAQCAEGVERLSAALGEDLDALRDVSVEEFGAHAAALPETVRERCRHVVTENDRVRRAADALGRGDLATVGELMFRSHGSLRDDYAVSCRELDVVVDLAAEHDAVHGARMTGAGFGGCVVSLVAAPAAGEVAASLAEGYRDATGTAADVYVCTPDEGWTGSYSS